MLNLRLQFVHDVQHTNRTEILRVFSIFCKLYKEVPTNLKGRSKSSQEWLSRQLADPYVEKAKMLNYRCRSAFKLIEIDDKFHLFSPGQCVIDCGAAPGSWTQVAVHRVNAHGKDAKKPVGKVIAIDRLPIYPVEGASVVSSSDFTTKSCQEKILEILGGKKVNVFLSDMAPNASGFHENDHDNIVHLVYSALRFAFNVSYVGSSLLVKIWDGRDATKLEQDIARFYENMKVVKPNASRTDSSEKFILGRNFKGLKT